MCKAVAEFAADDDLVVGGTIPPRFWKAVSSQFSNRVLVLTGLPDPLGDSPDGRQRHPGPGSSARDVVACVSRPQRRPYRAAIAAAGLRARGQQRSHGGEPGKPSWSSWPGSRRPRIHGAPGDPRLVSLGAARTPRRARRPRGGSRYPGTAAWYMCELVALLHESVADNRPVDRAGMDPHRGFDKAIWLGPVGWVAPGHLVVVEDVREVPGPEGAGQLYLSGDVAPAHR